MITLTDTLIITFAYFLGSISSAILICKILYLEDPRNYASKNPGATNIFRIGGYKLAAIVVLFDFLKGAIPIWIGSYCEISSIYLQITAFVSCIGHVYPIYFRFHGGKGVATAFGTLTAISIDFFVIMLSIWLFVVLLFRYVSLGSIVTAILMPFYVWYMHPQYFVLMILLSLLICTRHSKNMKRLWSRKEKQI